MRRKITYLLIFFMSLGSAMAQIDENTGKLPGKIYSSESTIGDWVSDANDKYTVQKDKGGELRMRKKGVSEWIGLARAGHNRYDARAGDNLLFEVSIVNENELEITDHTSGTALKIRVRKKIDGQVVGAEAGSQAGLKKDLASKGKFLSYYPSLHSPIALYGGLLNRKWNFYAGLSLSPAQLSGNFFEGQSEGDVHLSTNGDPNNEGLATGDKVVSQATLAIGLTSEIVKNRLRLHYGLGFGKYEVYRGFDLWARNTKGEWTYDRSVWTKDESTLVQGLYLEGGLIWDVGVLLSLGFGTIQFQQSDLRFGLGYAF